MDKIGVMAVVEGLNAFMGDMNQVDKAIDNLVPTSKLLGGALDWLGGIVNSVAGFIANTLSYALGNILADAVEWATKTLTELISTSFDLAIELQRLGVRLDGLNLNLIKSDTGITDFTKAMEQAKEMTKEQLQWIQQLAVASPFPPDKIAELYTAARQMDMTEQQARELTMAVLEFTAGVGGSDEVMDRVILNLRQMGMAGKVTGREMSDLARGALMPLEDVLVRMAEKMGISTDELRKLISTGEGVDPMLFVQAFEEMVKEEPRFVGAMGRLGRTFEAAMENFKQLLESLAASNIIMPVLDALGEAIAQVTDQFVFFDESTGELFHTEKWDAAVAAANSIGESLGYIISQILNLGPSAEGIADGIVSGLEGIAAWLNQNKDIIVEKVKEIRDWLFGSETREGAISKFFTWLTETAVPFVTDTVIPQFEKIGKALFGGEGETGAFQNILGIISDLTPAIEPLIELLGTLGEIIMIAFGGDTTQTFADFVTNTLVPAIENLTIFLEDNKDTIAFWIGIIGAALVAGMVLSVGLGILMAAFAEVGAALVGFFLLYQLWAARNLLTFGKWAVDTKEKLDTWADDVTTRISEWSATTKAEIDDWSNGTWTKLDTWAINTQSRIGTWSANTMATLNTWAANAIASNANWSATTSANISQWATTTWAKLNAWADDVIANNENWSSKAVAAVDKWAVNTLKKISTWATDTLKKISNWAAETLKKFINWAGTVYATVKEAMADFDWFEIGVAIISAIIDGFLSMSLPSISPPGIGGSNVGTSSKKNPLVAALSTVFDPLIRALGDALSSFSSALITRFEQKNLSPMQDTLKDVTDRIAEIDAALKLPGANIEALTAERILLVNEQLAIQNRITDAQAKILALQEQQANFDYLSAQMDFMKFLQENEIDAASIIGDKKLGLNLNVGDFMEMMTSALNTVNNQMSHALATGMSFITDTMTVSANAVNIMMSGSVGQSSVMAGSSVNSSNQINNAMNLNIYSSAPTENIIADFGMMRSMQGA